MEDKRTQTDLRNISRGIWIIAMMEKIQLDRDKQFEEVEDLFTWYDSVMGNYEAAFWVHYRILCRTIEIWIDEVKKNQLLARVTYFVNTEYMSIVLCELLLTTEVLLKAELIKAGCQDNLKTHNLIKLLDKMESINDDRCLKISKRFDACRNFFSMTDMDNLFINVRYLEYDRAALGSDTASNIKKVVSILDDIQHKYYSDFNIERLLYLGMQVDDHYDLSEDERRRLRNLGLI